jgi:hypothetical protein
MRIVIAVVALVACGLVADGLLGVATAETPTGPTTAVTAPQRTVSVQGVASEPLASEASAATATSVYRQAMAAAVADGQSKAQFLAEKAGATLGPVQNLAEGGGYIECPGNVEYTGGQPDFGYATGYGVVTAQSKAVATGRPVPFKGKRRVKRKTAPKRGSARRSTAGTCTLSTQVVLAYQLS